MLVYRKVPGFSEIAEKPLSPSLSPGLLCFGRPPAVRRRWTSSTARPRPNGPGESLSATWPPLGTSSRAHASQTPPRAATIPRPTQHCCLLRSLAVETPRAKSTAHSHYIPHPGAPWPIKTPRTPPSHAFSPSSSSRRSAMAAEIQLARTG